MNHKAHEDHKGHQNLQGHRSEVHDPLPESTERLIREIIGAGLAVHRALGPGFIEGVYERALAIELKCRGLAFNRQKDIPIRYRGEAVCTHRLDLVVGDCVVVEVKAVRKIKPIHRAQILSYLKAGNLRAGLLMNFNVKLFVDGLERFVR